MSKTNKKKILTDRTCKANSQNHSVHMWTQSVFACNKSQVKLCPNHSTNSQSDPASPTLALGMFTIESLLLK